MLLKKLERSKRENKNKLSAMTNGGGQGRSQGVQGRTQAPAQLQMVLRIILIVRLIRENSMGLAPTSLGVKENS